MKVDRHQVTFVLGSDEQGVEMEKMLLGQAKRIAKLLGHSKPNIQVALRVALRTLLTLKDKDIVLEGEFIRKN